MRAIENPAHLVRELSRVVAWATVPLFLAGIGSMFWVKNRLGLADEFPVDEVLLLVGFGAFAVVGSLLVAKKPSNPVSWIMTSIGLMVGLFPAAEAYAAYIMTTRGHPDVLAVFGAWVNAWYWYVLLSLSLIWLPLLFPDGHLPSRRWLPVAVIAGIGTAGFVVIGALSDPLTGQTVNYRINNPIGIEGMPPVDEGPFFWPLNVLILIGLLGATAAVVVRFRRSRGAERQQLKWFLYAVAFLPLMAIAAFEPVLLGLILIALPTAIGIAVLRYRLYDIDLLIRRTLVYGVLTASLAFVYFSSVVLLQALFDALTGREEQSPIVTVISTLAIAALFTPLRRRVQNVIDRRFYRRKYDAVKTLEAFGATVRDEVDPDRLSERLVAVVQETMQPMSVSLWLIPTANRRPQLADLGGHKE